MPWNLSSPCSRLNYLLWGGALGFLKFNLDRFLVVRSGNSRWSPLYYFEQSDFFGVFATARDYRQSVLLLVLCALPFVWLGISLTVRRLKSAGLTPGLALLFFVPLVNILFFIVLCLLPDRTESAPCSPPAESWLRRFMPETPFYAAVMSALLLAPLGVALAVFSTHWLKDYGAGLFVGLPFALGFLSVLLYGAAGPRGFASCFLVAASVTAVVGGALVAFAVEGIICVLMAAPIGMFLSFMGAAFGWTIHRAYWLARSSDALALALLAAVPALMGSEAAFRPVPPLFEVTTAEEIDAPPGVVWRHVVCFSEIPPGDDWVFRIGIASPRRAIVSGSGPGAVRHCEFTTGAFVEPITIWDEPNVLQFDVVSQPPPMEEWSPWNEVHPPHLDDFLRSKGGRFRLVPLDGGRRTRLEGTTWYEHSIWPSAYWRIYSDALIHRIHRRVLRHIKGEAEVR